MPRTPSLGALHGTVANRTGGRKIETWTFHSGAPTGHKEARNIVFQVALLPGSRLQVTTDDIPKERFTPLMGSDMEQLREQAEAAARAESELRMGLVWEDWLEIIVDAGSHRQKENGASAAVSYRPIVRGVLPDGKAYTMNNNRGHLISFPTNTIVVEANEWGLRGRTAEEQKAADEATTAADKWRLGMVTDSRSAHQQYTYLPDTPEHRAGLDALIAAIDTVNLRLQGFLRPETASEGLMAAANQGAQVLALAAPAEPAEPRRRPQP